MRKFLIALSTAASIIGAGAASYVFAVALTPLGPSSGCGEASQLLNCINAQVYAVLTGGVGQTRPISIGSFGTTAIPNGNTNISLNTQGGIVTVAAMNIAANGASNTVQINNSLVAASSQCLATFTDGGSPAAGSAPYVVSAVPSAGALNIVLRNAAINTGTGNFNVAIGFWCNN